MSEQAALVAELEDALTAAEGRASSAVAEASGLRRTAEDLAEADRSRRSRLAELEGKLLRLEHERRASAGPAGGGAEGDGRVVELEAERDLLRRRADDERAAWDKERGELRAELAERTRDAAGRNGHDAGGTVGRELEALEAELRTEAARLDALAHAIAGRETAGAGGNPRPGRGANRCPARPRRRPPRRPAGSRPRSETSARGPGACATISRGSAGGSTPCLRRRLLDSSRSWARIWPELEK